MTYLHTAWLSLAVTAMLFFSGFPNSGAVIVFLIAAGFGLLFIGIIRGIVSFLKPNPDP